MKKSVRRQLFLFSLVVLVSPLPIQWKLFLAIPSVMALLIDFEEFNYNLKNGGNN